MRVLILTSKPREPDNHLLWEGLQQLADVDLHYVTKEEQRHLGAVLKRFDLESYDRVVLDLLFRQVSRHARLLSAVAGLVLYEEDACQEFIRSSRWFGKFSAFYRKVPQARVIFTGYRVSEQFRAMGVDACFLPKGYDSSKLYDMQRPRDIELGFIGRLASDAYEERRVFLENATVKFGVQTLRTSPGDEYREMLNRIRVFVSADIGLGEYMAKNFEAMACGCLLVAHRQGGGEEEALGLVDGENVLLYDDFSGFSAILSRLCEDPSLSMRVSAAGKAHVSRFMDYWAQASHLYGLIAADCRPVVSRDWKAAVFCALFLRRK